MSISNEMHPVQDMTLYDLLLPLCDKPQE